MDSIDPMVLSPKAQPLSTLICPLNTPTTTALSSPCLLAAKDIVTWLKKRTGPPAEALEIVEAAKAFTEKEDVVVIAEKEDVVVIGFFEDESSDKATAYVNAADTQDTIFFGIVTSKEVAEYLEATMDSIVSVCSVC